MGVFEELKGRGLVAQVTNEEKVKELLEGSKIKFYVGFDPTADSLHVGHLVQMLVMGHLQKAGHTPIVLFGGGTGFVGDPSGRTDMRPMLTFEDINHNISRFKKQMEQVVDFTEDRAILVNNADWLLGLNYIEFLRDIGVHFSINRMLSFECYKNRLEKGLSFFELNYMIMQSYDFLHLNKEYGCVLEVGGDDQWSNIIGGVELVRKKEKKDAYGMTFALLTKSDGQKMGKTASGALWLDPKKVTPYDFYQYWRNIDDSDVEKCLKMLTFLPVEEIERLTSQGGESLNGAKKVLAYEVTKIVHGEAQAQSAQNAAQSIFSGNISFKNMPTFSLNIQDFTNGKILLVDVLAKSDLVTSKSEAKRLVEQGGVTLLTEKGEQKITDLEFKILKSDLEEKDLAIKKGKKIYKKIILE